MSQSSKTLHEFGSVNIKTPASNFESVTLISDGVTLPANKDVLCVSALSPRSSLVMADGRDAQQLTILNKSATTLEFDISKATANFEYAGSHDKIPAGGVVTIIYDGTAGTWRYISGTMTT